MNNYGPRHLEVAVLEDVREFAELEEEWEELYRHCSSATPFQSWAWLYSWWEHYGEGYELRLITLREEGGLLVGLLPLMLERRWGFGRLLLVGVVQTDYQDVLVRDGWEGQVSEAASRALGRLEGWQVADLQQLRPAAAAWSVFRRWGGLHIRTWQENCPVIEVRPWDELVASLSKNYRSTVRRTLRRMEADELDRWRAEPQDAAQAARRLVDLHRELWRGRDIVPEHSSQRWGYFVEAAFSRMMARGLAGMSEFRREEETLVSLSWVFGQDFVAFYHSGASRDALHRYQWSSLLIWEGLDIAHDRESKCLDLLRGEEPYKMRWASKAIRNYRAVLGQNLLVSVPYAAFHVLRSRAKSYAAKDSTPRWVKVIVYQLKRVRRIFE